MILFYEIDRRSVLIEFSMRYSFTLAIHSCGSHRDYFNSKINDGKSSTLENKICLRTKHFTNRFGGGRLGGGRTGYFTFAVVDW